MIWGKPATVTGGGPGQSAMVTCLCRPGRLRDHRAEIKHSLVDPVQLPHMHERALSSGVVPVIRTWVITGRFEDRGGVRASLAGAMRGYFRPGGGGTFVPGRWRWQD